LAFIVLKFQLNYVGRGISPIPATGIGEVHKKEAKEIVDAVFVG